jgi:hypothetical protein
MLKTTSDEHDSRQVFFSPIAWRNLAEQSWKWPTDFMNSHVHIMVDETPRKGTKTQPENPTAMWKSAYTLHTAESRMSLV